MYYMLDGYKTYIIAFLMMINGVLFGFGLYSLEVFSAVTTILVGGGFAATKSANQKDRKTTGDSGVIL